MLIETCGVSELHSKIIRSIKNQKNTKNDILRLFEKQK